MKNRGNIALITAGGSGVRMHSNGRPKQFLELYGKPIIIYTVELFECHPDIDGIILVCLESWITYLQKELRKYEIEKVIDIVPGGLTGQQSIYNGLRSAAKWYSDDSYVLIHDGVRPLITFETISESIRTAHENGNCITCSPSVETCIVEKGGGNYCPTDRKSTFIVRAPQIFKIGDILEAHKRAIEENRQDFVDSSTLMKYYGTKLYKILGPDDNIKITTPTDFYLFRTLLELREQKQIFG